MNVCSPNLTEIRSNLVSSLLRTDGTKAFVKGVPLVLGRILALISQSAGVFGISGACAVQGSATMKDGKPVSESGTWTLTNGTGKLKGITGKGTYKGTPNPDGSMTYAVEGEYSQP